MDNTIKALQDEVQQMKAKKEDRENRRALRAAHK